MKMEYMNTRITKSSAGILPPFITIADTIGTAPASGTTGLRMLAQTRLPQPKSICYADLLTTAFSDHLLKLTQHYPVTAVLHQSDASAPKEFKQPHVLPVASGRPPAMTELLGVQVSSATPVSKPCPCHTIRGGPLTCKEFIPQPKKPPHSLHSKHKKAQQTPKSPALLPSFPHSAASTLPAAGKFGTSGRWQTNSNSLITH